MRASCTAALAAAMALVAGCDDPPCDFVWRYCFTRVVTTLTVG